MTTINFQGEKIELKKLNEDCYRCGYCGRQTNEQGGVLSEDEVNALDELGADWDKAVQVNGECCRHI